jgi:hypothetical protein
VSTADLNHRRHLAPALAMLAAGPVAVERLHRLPCGRATPLDAARLGEGWTRDLLDHLLVRAGPGRLQRDARGRLVLAPTPAVPTAAAAWERIVTSWPPCQ